MSMHSLIVLLFLYKLKPNDRLGLGAQHNFDINLGTFVLTMPQSMLRVVAPTYDCNANFCMKVETSIGISIHPCPNDPSDRSIVKQDERFLPVVNKDRLKCISL